MSFQWTAVAGFLYVEIALTLLLILPLLKSKTWKWIFGWRVFSALQPVWTTVFYAILLVLVVLFADSIRTMMKYGKDLPQPGITLDTKIDRHLHECRGQRNFYITGFSLFLILVIRRLITMHSQWVTLEASHEATFRQAQAANTELNRRLEEEAQRGEGDDSKPKTKQPSQEEFETMQTELKKAQTDLSAMKKQAESTSTEYDRLAEEHQKLQNQLREMEGEEESKKDQ